MMKNNFIDVIKDINGPHLSCVACLYPEKCYNK